MNRKNFSVNFSVYSILFFLFLLFFGHDTKSIGLVFGILIKLGIASIAGFIFVVIKFFIVDPLFKSLFK